MVVVRFVTTVVVVNDRGVVVEVVYTRPTIPRVGTKEGRP